MYKKRKVFRVVFCPGVRLNSYNLRLFLFVGDGCHHPAVLLAAFFRGIGGIFNSGEAGQGRC